MPKALASKDAKKYDLETLPEGWVKLRKLSYGEVLKRREMSSRLSAPMNQARNGEAKVDFAMVIQDVQVYEFGLSIIDHNLEDDAGKKLDFNKREHVTGLDSRVAQEIEQIIDSLNQPGDLSPLGTKSSDSSVTTAVPQ